MNVGMVFFGGEDFATEEGYLCVLLNFFCSCAVARGFAFAVSLECKNRAWMVGWWWGGRDWLRLMHVVRCDLATHFTGDEIFSLGGTYRHQKYSRHNEQISMPMLMSRS